MNKKIKSIVILSKAGYIIGCTTLYGMAIWIVFCALLSIARDVYRDVFTVYKLLDEVALLVFSIAVIDVTKYLMMEEVLREGGKREAREEKKALTKFVMIIATALALEGLVLTIETAKTDLEKMVYPAILLLLSIVFIIGVGIYQKLTHSHED